MSLYVYCLGEDLPEAAFDGVAGVGGASVRLLKLGRLAAVVSESGGGPPAVTDENVLAHNRVNAAALACSTPLPFRFGTRATRERLAAYASANEAALLETLARVRGCVEMSVKLMWKAGGAEESERSGDAEVGARGAAGAGTAFLLAKRREIACEEDSRRRAAELAAWLSAGVSGLVRESVERVRPSGAIALAAAHLVERARVGEYRERLRSLGAARPVLRLLTSGPWPPYSFTGQGRER